ncbi:HSP20-like chaperones superfamily protein [Heracleum sosnowskyi]|uniref:HSP20-like chaperones superfamily protein n=1 Tax=Heracleum sosnowskyi TaxID=360622 RepID=A0AAD8M214_9APIA|nr:HSP20-like chaperones superfamily protein [Heracleum sosnowskyi]
MANPSATKGCAGKKCTSTAMLEELVPPSGWSQDSDSHYLVLALPGFKKEEVRLQVNNRGEIITSGERQTVGNKLVIRFLQTFKIPENSITEKITGKFEGEVLYVTVPKLKKDDDITKISYIPKPRKKPKNDDNITKTSNIPEPKHDDNITKTEPENDDNFTKPKDIDGYARVRNQYKKIAENLPFNGQGIIKEDWDIAEESGMLLQSVVKNLKEKQGILITAVLAFSLGVLVSRKFSK